MKTAYRWFLTVSAIHCALASGCGDGQPASTEGGGGSGATVTPAGGGGSGATVTPAGGGGSGATMTSAGGGGEGATVASGGGGGTTSSGSGTTGNTATGMVCPELGWCQLTNTKLADFCPENTPEYDFSTQCGGIIAGWSGGVADTENNRLYVWGGGHNDYFGNEVYALDLNDLTMKRLNDPGPLPPMNVDKCGPEALADGTPNSRHTYGGLAYIAKSPARMFVYGGGLAALKGCLGDGTWLLDLDVLQATHEGTEAWTSKDPHAGPTPGGAPGTVTDYDPNTKKVFLHDTATGLYTYDDATNTYAQLSQNSTDYHMTGVIDPKRKLFVLMGGDAGNAGGVQVFDIKPGSSYQRQSWTDQVTGCDAIAQAASPGLAYDPVQDRIVGWAGGDDIYLFDVDAKSCSKVSYAGSPPPVETPKGTFPAQPNGTFGRFRYFPKLGVFAVVNDWQQDAYALRLTQ